MSFSIKTLYTTLIFLASCLAGNSQNCSTIGQTPSTAFPVCGTDVFTQEEVGLCGGTPVSGPCSQDQVDDRNPYFYKFTCFKAGTLGFTITPTDLGDDYDWQIFDVTGKNANDIYTDASLFLTCNWSGESGLTGASAAGTQLSVCGGYGKPLFSRMAQLIEGHNYLLLISHFTATQSGYKLGFGGGTASITDTTKPHLKTLDAFCDGRSLRIKLNKRMRCSTVATNGSDFKLSPALVDITAASGVGCGTGFDTDSIVLTLSGPLPVGSYDLIVKKGQDGNTLLDNCSEPLPENEQLNVKIIPLVPSPMDSMIPVLCKPDVLRLIFNKPMLCNTVAANGSDFSVSGPSAVTVVGASGASCTGGTSKMIEIKLAAPIKLAGQYTITLHTGTDGNTVLNECQKETLAGSTLRFTGYDSVSPRIDYTIKSSCIDDTLHLSNAGGNGVNNWKWIIDNGAIQTRQLEDKVFSNGNRSVKLTVSNGICSDSATVTINFDKIRLKAVFESPKYVCPFDTARFTDSSKGPVTGWNWDFGNGQTSNQKTPAYQFYPNLTTLEEYTVKLVVNDSIGCLDSTSRIVTVPSNCYIAVPTAFTPDGDGLNDYLYPLSAYKATGLSFKVYNRYGKLVWETTDWTRKWDGRINGNLQQSGTYVWYLTYTDDKNVPIKLQGTTTLIR